MNCRDCPKCGAKWIDGVLYWSTGQKGDPAVLANLVCDLPQVQRGGGCINETAGDPKKDTWSKRRRFSEMLARELGDDENPEPFLRGFHD